ncbi:hypothetical protein U471_12760 [Bacillus sp. CN2]|nr:hypothetical protein U471_12760 [Bacillus amyloliquefaciens CC178]AHZ15241.1 hypothetical protein V529_12150 [Bacillus velezensis SQR9]ANF36191.1 hypothetical protein BCBMB205_12910 [Bacillus velezensis]QEY88422.1 hypothetical protein BACIT_0447 [Bacillus amyloliquefaciens]GFR53914.1 hypothetical protein U471_12760 [Bacillus sp. CN2]
MSIPHNLKNGLLCSFYVMTSFSCHKKNRFCKEADVIRKRDLG